MDLVNVSVSSSLESVELAECEMEIESIYGRTWEHTNRVGSTVRYCTKCMTKVGAEKLASLHGSLSR